jgi:2,4-dienoyl-CoA reductase-like NADH-dependent reductase (Old Yellow Enzyme family)
MALAAVHLDILVDHFVQSTRLAPRAGFEVLELHMAHSYLLPAFLSPLANLRSDDYGGSLDKRTAFSLRAAQAVREARPAELRLLVRVSCTDWVEGGWDLPSTIEFASQLKQLRADLVDCSSAGTAPDERIPIGPGFQTPVAAAMPGHAGMPSAAGGLITTAEQAEHVLHAGQADVVSLGRAPLRDPYWPLHAAAGLRANVDAWSPRYQRARPS